MTTAVAVVLPLIGSLGILRSVVIVMGRGSGRFRFDPAVSHFLGFASSLLGQSLLR